MQTLIRISEGLIVAVSFLFTFVSSLSLMMDVYLYFNLQEVFTGFADTLVGVLSIAISGIIATEGCEKVINHLRKES